MEKGLACIWTRSIIVGRFTISTFCQPLFVLPLNLTVQRCGMRPEATWRTEESATISTFCQPLFCVTFESYCSKTASIIHKPLNLLTLRLLAHLRVLCEKKGRERAPQPIAGLLLAGVHSNRRPVLLLFPRFVNHYFVFVLYLTLPRNGSLLHTP